MSHSLATSWTIAHQSPLPIGFSRQEYWSGSPFPSPGDPPDPGIKPTSPASAGGFFTAEPPGKPCLYCRRLDNGPHPLPNLHVLISGTCEYGTLCGERNSEDVIKFKILRWRAYSWLSEWPQHDPRSPQKGEGQESWSQKKKTCQEELRVESCGWEPRDGLEAGRGENRLSSGDSRREQACCHLDLNPLRMILSIWLPRTKRKNVCVILSH